MLTVLGVQAGRTDSTNHFQLDFVSTQRSTLLQQQLAKPKDQFIFIWCSMGFSHGSPEAKDNIVDTALLRAAYCGHLDVVRYLVEQGADKEATAIFGYTVPLRAVFRGHLDVVTYLVEHGAEKEAKDKDGNTVLLISALNNNLDVSCGARLGQRGQ